MGKAALIVANGLHPPWNMGEIVLSRNFACLLKNLYEDIKIISTIDKARENEKYSKDVFDDILGDIVYVDKRDLGRTVRKECNKAKVDVHLLHNIDVENLLLLRKRIFFYQFSYKAFDSPVLRMYVAPILASLGRMNILTTCLKKYKQLNQLFRKNYHYIPAPLLIPQDINFTFKKKLQDLLKITYIGHASYKRFPYIELFNMLVKLNKEKYNILFDIYFSKLRSPYFNNVHFIEHVKSAVINLNLTNIVRIHFGNLTEKEKYTILGTSDVFLYPAISEVAVDPPITILEAMAAGCCVISTPVQSNSFILRYGRGILLPNFDFNSVSRILKILIEEPCLLKSYGDAARQYIKNIHSSEAVSRHLENIINYQV